MYTARQNGSFSRVIPEQRAEKRPYREVCLYTAAVCKPGRNAETCGRDTNKNAPQQCGAFGAENETRTQIDSGTTVYMVWPSGVHFNLSNSWETVTKTYPCSFSTGMASSRASTVASLPSKSCRR